VKNGRWTLAPGQRLTGAQDAAYWTAPLLACLLLHWLGFTAWFRADDFAWLGLADGVHNFRDLLITLFQPRAQGTIRPWSERAFFMAGSSLFGLNVLPFRIVIFGTQFADTILVMVVGNRLAGMRAAGFWAAMFWVVNSSLAEPLGWVCVYNEVLCAFFLLLALYFLLRWIETGQTRFNLYQWIVFVLGFGALELNVVYPALAAGYTFLCARKHFRRTLPMFAVSALYALAHNWAAPPPKAGDYVMHFDGSMFRTLGTLWEWSVGSTYLSSPLGLRHWMMLAGVSILSLALAWFAWREWRAGRRAALFCLLWYLATVGPLLPLRDHVTEYYVYLPVIGVCWLGGWAVARHPGVPAYALAGLYVFLTVPQLMVSSEWNYRQTHRAEDLVEGVASAHQHHPRQWILLAGVDTDLFWHGIRDHPFRLLGIDHVYLAPGTEKQIESHAGWGDAEEFVLPGSMTTRALERDELVVYDVKGSRLRNITSLYASLPRDQSLPLRLDAADPLTSDLLGPEWYPVDENHRWMPKRATLKMAGPPTTGRSLYLHGNCMEQQLAAGPLTVTVTVDNWTLPAAPIRETSFELEFRLPDALAGKREMQVAVEVSRTFRPPADARDLGLAFGFFEVR
jgi:hypothetical protein